MKTSVSLVLLLLSLSAWAAPKSATCQMYSRNNEASLVITISGEAASVKMGDADAEQCVLANDASYDLHVRCGGEDEATFFGIKRRTGKIYADFGTIAQLKDCRIQN